MSIETLVHQYKKEHASRLEERLSFYRNLSPDEFFDHLRNFGRAKIQGKWRVSAHFINNRWFNRLQQNISGESVQLRDALISILKEEGVLDDPDLITFDEIFARISLSAHQLAFNGVKGAGRMTIYDISLLIGAKRHIMPDKVYIHRGVRDGAFSLRIVNKRTKDCAISLGDVIAKAPEVKDLGNAAHIENFLCIYKKQLASLSNETHH